MAKSLRNRKLDKKEYFDNFETVIELRYCILKVINKYKNLNFKMEKIIIDNDFKEDEGIKVIGKIITIDNLKIFNAIIKNSYRFLLN